MKHDYIKAHDILERHNKWRRGDDDERMADPAALGAAIDIALHALLLADKLMQEPSEDVAFVGVDANSGNVNVSPRRRMKIAFKAMIEQAQREIEG